MQLQFQRQVWHGAFSRVDSDATAFGFRGDVWNFDAISQWLDPAEAEQHVRWTRECWGAVEPFAMAGGYVNHLAADDGERVRASYGDNYERLVDLKNKYDPANLFRLNQNIRPTA